MTASVPRRRAKKPITIVTYHSIGQADDPYSISAGAFARQIRFMHARYPVLRLEDIGDALRGDGRLARRVVLTFDDAFLDFYDVAHPILQELQIPSTVFVPTGFIGGHNDWEPPGSRCRRKPLMTRQHLKELHRSGLTDFGSHTIDHVRMSRLTTEEMRRQAADSRASLEELLDAPIRTFAYPYGMLDDFSAESTRVLAEAGYDTAVTSHWGTWNSAADMLRLRRISLEETDTDAALARKIEGGQDWIALKERIGFWKRRLRGQARARRS